MKKQLNVGRLVLKVAVVVGTLTVVMTSSACSSSTSPSAPAPSVSPAAPSTPGRSTTQAASTPQSSQTANPNRGLWVEGTVSYEDSLGYTYQVQLDWNSGYAVSDVGSNPPGKTDVVMTPVRPYRGSFLNTTVGGRTLPGVPWVDMYGIYPINSLACDQADFLYEGVETCILVLQPIILSPGNGAFDSPPYPNGQPITFGYKDFAQSNAWPEGTHTRWEGVDETLAPAIVEALNEPLGYGISAGESNRELTVTSGPTCTFNRSTPSRDSKEIALLGDSSNVPSGC